MARFNTKVTNKTATTNLAGGSGYSESPKLELASLILTSMLKDMFYENADDRIARLRGLVATMPDKQFAAKAAIYARNEFGLRSVSHVVAGELAKNVKGANWTAGAIEKIVRRADDMLEIMSYYQATYGKRPIPNCLKKGLAKAVHKFNRYKLSKYRGENRALSMVDLFNIVRPKPRDSKEEKLFRDLMTGNLKSTETWEAKLTEAGKEGKTKAQVDELKKQSWKELLEEGKLGYFALLRNLRNIAEQAPECVGMACEQLMDREKIKKSLVLPFRFKTALDNTHEIVNIGNRRLIQGAIRNAAEIALENVPVFDGDTLVVLDVSGSMQWGGGTQPNGKPAPTPAEIGAMFAAVLFKSNNADFMTFQSYAQYRNLDPSANVLTLAENMQFKAGGTNFHAIFEVANKKYDRVIILSDMQGWIGNERGNPRSSFAKYCKKYDADPEIYSFDLQGYGQLMFPERKAYCIAGFSEKIFEFMSNMTEGKRAEMVRKIEAVEL